MANKDVWGIVEEQQRHIASSISFSSDISYFSDTHFLQAYVAWELPVPNMVYFCLVVLAHTCVC